MADQDNLVQAKADNISLVLYCLGILSGVVEVLQFIEQQGSGKEGLPQGKIVALIVSISLIASAASLALRPRYNTICCRLCFLFSVFSCAFLLSPLVPIKLFWVPYFSCVFPFLHLLQLLPAPLQQYLQQLRWATWKAIRDAAGRAHQAIVRSFEALLPTTSSSVASNSNPGRFTSSSSSSAPALARIIQEGDPQVINVNDNNNSCGGGDI
ncbi:hypothetical protein MRB53_011461 [Persea americana]|uniref:Uncharacterized protein n=1 Tax=Persea americana TaxID=3435 RepID=A0ACC2LUU2_PERAE|nr:hypothetical protein MRB53_011461 [Persea americana]